MSVEHAALKRTHDVLNQPPPLEPYNLLDADLALRDSEARFRVMADSTPLLIWVSDMRGRIVFANQACELFTRRSGPDLLATDPIIPIHPEEREEMAELFRRSLGTGDPFELECRKFNAKAQRRKGAKKSDH